MDTGRWHDRFRLLPGATGVVARAMSADGNSVVGYCRGFVDPKIEGEAFLWTPADGMVGLGGLIDDPVGFFIWSGAQDISWDGSVVVGTGHGNTGEFGQYASYALDSR